MSINALRLQAARRRALRSRPLTQSPTRTELAADGKPNKRAEFTRARMQGYNPSSDNYTIVDDLGNRKGATYIPGNNPGSGAFDLRDEGLFGQGFYLA